MMLSELFGVPPVGAQRLRQEIFSLGGRHRGEPLAGALQELKDPDLSVGRKALLRAVVLHLDSSTAAGLAAAPSRQVPAFIHARGSRLALILAATACLVVVGLGLLAGH